MAQGDDFAQSAYYQARWLQVTANLDGTQNVTLRVFLLDDKKPDAPGRVVYKGVKRSVKDRYQSPEIFLDYHGPGILSYRIELSHGDGTVKSASFHRMLLNLTNNTACLRGIRFRDIDEDKTDKWYSFRPINLKNVADGTALEIIGSNMYFLGHLVIHKNANNEIMFEIVGYDQLFPQAPDAPASPLPRDHEIVFSSVRLGVYHKFAEISDVSHSAVSKDIKLSQWYNLTKKKLDVPVILYLSALVTYNPNGLPRVDAHQNESALFRLMERFAY
jgi:hypothetical protein